ncbi:MAG: ABC transporter permease [Actinobacteria bacterium]|uniref:Unannotated protein n=1 Tax=freshwater metagenome TaxID=449393 RepID=A0A6J7L117_9ZZZZ|nr:ABC transporter permease [Actinomycetota bacterium]
MSSHDNVVVDQSVDFTPRSPGNQRRGRRSVGYFFEAYALLFLLIAVAVFFSLWPTTSDTFPTLANLQILLGNQAVIGIVALGALIPLIANEWDLSIGAIAGVSSIVTALAMSNGIGAIASPAIGLALGATFGLVNAVIVTKFGVNGVITTLGTATLLDGVTNQVTGGLAITTDIPDVVVNFGLGNWFGIPSVIFALVAAAVAVAYVLGYTPFGRYLYAIGSNVEAAKLVGIRVRLIIASAFVCSGLLAAAGGILSVARQAGADPRIGVGLTLPALAAAFLSAAAIKPGRYNVGGVIVAIFFLAVINNGLALAGVPAYVSSYVNGAALIVGVGLAAYLGRRRTGRTL